jgi:hypothetical protein
MRPRDESIAKGLMISVKFFKVSLKEENLDSFLYYEDNLDILKRYISDETGDLAYLQSHE